MLTEDEKALARREAASEASEHVEEGLRSVVRFTPYPMLICAGDRIMFGNTPAAKLLGLGDQRLLEGRPLSDMLGNDERSDIEMLLASEDSAPLGPFPSRIRRMDGSAADVEMRADLDRHEGAVVVRLLLLERVIRRRPQPDEARSVQVRSTEERLREAEARYDSLFTGNHTVMLLIDPDSGDIVDANSAACEFYGWSREELVSKKISEVNTLSFDEVRMEMGLAMAKQRRHFNFRHRLASGEIRDVEVYSGPIQVSGRNRLYSMVHDVTERVRAEKALRESEVKFRTLFQSTTDAIFVHTMGDGEPGCFIDVNDVACQRLGYSREELLSISPTAIVQEDEIRTFLDALERLEFSGMATFDLTLTGRDGSVPTEVSARVITLRGQKAVMSVARDITERKMWEGALQEANEKLIGWVGELEARNAESATIAEMGELLQTCTSFEDAYAVVAHTMPRLFPAMSGTLYVIEEPGGDAVSRAEWGTMPHNERTFAPDECWGLRRGRIHELSAPGSGLGCRHVRSVPEGGYLCIPMMAHGEAIGVFHLRARSEGVPDSTDQLATTVSEHIGLALANLSLRQTLREQAIRDPLTGLFNRRHMEEMLEREISRAQRRGTDVGVLMVDVDHFKRFNDVFGHDAGDQLLSSLGAHLKRHVREEDIACRYGGEEFILILPEAGGEATRRRAHELLAGIRDLRVEHRGQPLGRVTVSIGTAVYPEHAASAQEIVKAADVALYQAKRAGRDRVICAGL